MTKNEKYWLVAKDNKEMTFSIDGLTSNDSHFTQDVASLIAKGAPIGCDTPWFSKYPTRECVIQAIKSLKYEYRETSVLDKYR